jgi:PEP-CTERM motif
MPSMYRRTLVATAVLALAGLLASPAQATFIEDPDPGGEKFYIFKPATGSTSFCGFVSANQDCTAGLDDDLEVNVTTNTGVKTGDGYATIKPDTGVLTTLTFTPENPGEFGDFSFEGQPLADVTEANPITVTVLDNQGNPSQIFTFFGMNKNANFDRIGIVSIDDETIKEVTISFASGFKEVKHIDFSLATSNLTPTPEPATLLLLGSGLVGAGIFGRKRLARKQS